MNINSKIYIAGHNGLVGSSICKTLTRLGYKNLITASFSDLDLRNQQAVNNFFEQQKPEYVFLAAAKVGGILANDTYKVEFIYDNLMIAANIIHAAYKYGVKKLLNLGSSCIYPKLAPQPLKEEYLLSGYLESTNEPYAIAKITAIKLCRYYNEQYGTNFISAMPTNLYGPGDNFNLETAHVLPMLLRKFHLAKLLYKNDWDGIKKDLKTYKFGFNQKFDFENKEQIKNTLKSIGVTSTKVMLWGTGSPYREFLHVHDLINALIYLMKNCSYTDIGEIINIGTGIDVQIKSFASLVKYIVGFKGEIVFDNLKPDGTPKKLLNVSRINKLGWKNSIDLETGIKNFYEWYLSKVDQRYNFLSDDVAPKKVYN